MEPKFIELHDRETGDLYSINIQHIVACGKKGVILTGIPANIALATVESYDEIKQLIHDSGILIHRADPRLDETHPLTMEDLKEMIGEPVWNSNLLRWELVKKADDMFITTRGTGQYDSLYDENDLIKTPLYRMRRTLD